MAAIWWSRPILLTFYLKFWNIKRTIFLRVEERKNEAIILKEIFVYDSCGSYRILLADRARSYLLLPEIYIRLLGRFYPDSFKTADRQTGMASSTRLVMVIKNIYTLWGRKLLLYCVANFWLKSLYPLQGYKNVPIYYLTNFFLPHFIFVHLKCSTLIRTFANPPDF